MSFHSWRRAVVALGYVALLTHASLADPRAAHDPGGADWLFHLLSYLLLALLLAWAFGRPGRGGAVGAAAGAILVGVVLELLQTLTPLRGFEVRDLAWNAAGSLLAGICVRAAREFEGRMGGS